MDGDISTTLTVTPIMAYLGAWLSTCGLFWVLFSRGETILSLGTISIVLITLVYLVAAPFVLLG